MGCAAPAVVAPLEPPARRLAITSHELGKRLFACDATLTALGFTPDGDRVAAGCIDGSVHVFDLEGRERTRSVRHERSIREVAYLDDGTLVTSGSDGKLRIGESVYARVAATETAASGSVVAYMPDEESVALVRSGSVLRIEEPFVRHLALSRDGSLVALVGSDLVVAETATGRVRARRWIPPASRGCAFLPGEQVAILSDFHVWSFGVRRRPLLDLADLEGGVAGTRPTLRCNGLVEWFAAARDGTVAALRAERDHVLRVSIEHPDRPTKTLLRPGERAPVAFSPDSKLLAIGRGACIELVATRSGMLVSPETGHADAIVTLELSRDGATLLSTALDRKILTWDLATGASPVLRGATWHLRAAALDARGTGVVLPEDRIEAFGLGERVTCALSPGGRLVAWGWSDGAITLADAASGTEIRSWRDACADPVDRISFSPDGSSVVATRKGQLLVRDIESGADRSPRAGTVLGFGATERGLLWVDEALRLQPPNVALDARGAFAVISRDGELVALGGSREVPVCDARTGRLLATIQGHAGHVTAIAFDERGENLATGDAVGAIRLSSLER